MKEGLKPRSRNFVHLSESTDSAVQVGARHVSPILLLIDTEAMIKADYKFYRVHEGVWVTTNIPVCFIKSCISYFIKKQTKRH